MKFFNHLFGKNKKNNDDEESPFLPKETEPIELIFAKNFTKKGGKFCIVKIRMKFYNILMKS